AACACRNFAPRSGAPRPTSLPHVGDAARSDGMFHANSPAKRRAPRGAVHNGLTKRSGIAVNRTIGRHYLIASDFDQTLSFNDSGLVLSSLLGIEGYAERVKGLARTNLVQQGGELAYLIRHDPEFRGVRHEHLVETGKRVRLKGAIPALVRFLEQ